ncbi:MAG TPA: DNA polymerase III subunit delta [Acidimicrobiales bacterium]|nr:DNA polymerase III subunit delta [Acidimicrobiales bacterium]
MAAKNDPTDLKQIASGKTHPLPVYLVRGDDPSLVAETGRTLVTALVGERDGASVVEEHGSALADDLDVAPVIDALCTPSLLADRRVIVVRDAGRLTPADAKRLVEHLETGEAGESASTDVVLVLLSGGGTVPAPLVRAVERVGGVLDTVVGTGRARSRWLTDRLKTGSVRLDARAADLLSEHLGSDLNRVRGVLETLESVYGEGAAIDEERLEPFLGARGSIPTWELTDAIDSGDIPRALERLSRLTYAGGAHPLVILAVLHRHYQTMLRLDGLSVSSAEEAASLIGARSTYPVKKALDQAARLGSARIGRAIVLIADADLDLRGRTALDSSTVLEVLVARLTQHSNPRRAQVAS